MSKNEHMREAPMQRTRRNIVAMGALVVAAIGANLASIKPASAQQNDDNQGNNNNKKDKNRKCFLRGTAIRTSEGDRKVEELAVGDLVPTLFGGTRPIQWIGRYRNMKSDSSMPWGEDARPVRIARSALGPDSPRADLYLTQKHALFVDGVLVRAGNLINGTTITLDAANAFDELEFFHIKLETHDVIYAEGAACETLSTVDDYEYASNFIGFGRHGAGMTEATLCAPLLTFDVPRARMKSRFRSAISPWIDRRQKFDVVRDRLEERGVALSRQSALRA